MDKNSPRYQKGIEALRRHIGEDADKYVDAIAEVAPLFAKVNVEFAYGDIYNDENRVLDDKTKELTTISALTVMGYAMPQLKLHIEAALRCGASKEEIVETITQMLAYCGFPAATNAIMAAKEIFQQKGLMP